MRQTPLPMVSGRYFFPKAPLLRTKRIPAAVVTSVNRIGPVGRSAAGATDAVFFGAGDFSVAAAFSVVAGFDLQPAASVRAPSIRQTAVFWNREIKHIPLREGLVRRCGDSRENWSSRRHRLTPAGVEPHLDE